eukprot:4245818-Amphidinium_carterae.1
MQIEGTLEGMYEMTRSKWSCKAVKQTWPSNAAMYGVAIMMAHGKPTKSRCPGRSEDEVLVVVG